MGAGVRGAINSLTMRQRVALALFQHRTARAADRHLVARAPHRHRRVDADKAVAPQLLALFHRFEQKARAAPLLLPCRRA
jgi:hypothetical protein